MTPSSSSKMRLIGIVLVLITTCAAGDDISETEEAFRCHFLVPYITKDAPKIKLSVRYSSEIVNLGNKIPAYSACIPPYIYYEAEPDQYYVIVFVDVDWPYPGAPIYATYLHALVVNIPGNNLVKANYVTPYTPVNPIPGGYHRFVFYLFKQSKKIDITSPEIKSLPLNLSKFSVEGFAKKYELECIAGNFFMSQHIVCDDDDGIPQKCSL